MSRPVSKASYPARSYSTPCGKPASPPSLSLFCTGATRSEKFKDKYRERLNAAISEKMASNAPAEAKPAQSPARVVDILEALRASLTQAKKPAAGERQNRRTSAPPARKRSVGGKGK